MRVHLPKPLHGWREFAGEVGIIVLGVLIALGFGQIAEDLGYLTKADSTRKALANESLLLQTKARSGLPSKIACATASGSWLAG